MNKINKTLRFVLLVITFGLFIASCSSKFPSYSPKNEDVTWEAGTYNTFVTADQTPITINIQRGVGNAALNVPISFKSYTIETESYTDADGNPQERQVEVANDYFHLAQSSVNFEANQFTVPVQVTYDVSNLEPGNDYLFAITFDSNIAGPAGYNEVIGTAKLKLEYEDYMDGYYDEYAFVDLNAMAWSYGTGCIAPEFDDTEVKLQLAKGTTDYYKLIVFNDMELEFKLEADGSTVIEKYEGYNDKITALTATQVLFDGHVGSDTFSFTYRLANSGMSSSSNVVAAGDYMTFEGWIRKNGTYYPNSYNTYSWISFQ